MMLTRYVSILLVGGLLALVLGSPAEAKNKKFSDDGPPALANSGEVVFTASERTLIVNYFSSGGYAAGSSRGKPLPPGIAKKVARGGSLPPGIAKRYLPQDLDVRLPPPPTGAERVIVGGDVLLVEISTGAILDMIRDAVR